MQYLFYFQSARYTALQSAMADRQKKESDHRRSVEEPHATLKIKVRFLQMMALGKESVELRVN